MSLFQSLLDFALSILLLLTTWTMAEPGVDEGSRCGGSPRVDGMPPMEDGVPAVGSERIVNVEHRYVNDREVCYRPQSSCGKVMFSQACVKNSVTGRRVCIVMG